MDDDRPEDVNDDEKLLLHSFAEWRRDETKSYSTLVSNKHKQTVVSEINTVRCFTPRFPLGLGDEVSGDDVETGNDARGDVEEERDDR